MNMDLTMLCNDELVGGDNINSTPEACEFKSSMV